MEPAGTSDGRGMGERSLSYADAGVDLDAADRSVELLSAVTARAGRPEVIGGIGGFGGLFAFDAHRYRQPVLVSSSDGIGTKAELARSLGRFATIGRDLVAMVVDDLVVCGAEPLFLNDYLAVGRLDPERVATIVSGVADGCAEANCALVGGETAEHPGVLAEDAFDLAGFGVGVVERDGIIGPHEVVAGDVLIAMASSGAHSNGYSLIRRIVADHDLDAVRLPTDDPGVDRRLSDLLIEPTRIYAPDCLALLAQVDVHALCHVTGGGLPGNLPRILPDGLGAEVDASSWRWPPLFRWLADNGPVDDDDMWATFNLGVGMVAVVAPHAAGEASQLLADRQVSSWRLGRVVEVSEGGARTRFVGG